MPSTAVPKLGFHWLSVALVTGAPSVTLSATPKVWCGRCSSQRPIRYGILSVLTKLLSPGFIRSPVRRPALESDELVLFIKYPTISFLAGE